MYSMDHERNGGGFCMKASQNGSNLKAMRCYWATGVALLKPKSAISRRANQARFIPVIVPNFQWRARFNKSSNHLNVFAAYGRHDEGLTIHLTKDPRWDKLALK